ncbi:hypothetical protein [Novosphingobium sp. Gsoil 351]|uniref:hypothetical protein n=1 Tax=Novosphingobium sp. Gsoil 351 TaxID=2675225 RepID=UPI0012B46FFF|nr:hypothetical protein [Novosphingobium sp. Gsoil 351]QGN54236.1 hypothetical protein GKE62_06410 [Novosphingobium sp. Gsoil 351]
MNGQRLRTRWPGFPPDNLTNEDLKKVEILTTKIYEQLKSYGFRSFQPGEIALSTDNFRPLVRERKGSEIVEKEINFEVSASDAIRLKWAYLLAAFELMRDRPTNHPGLVIFDEPGQQEIDSGSLFAFLKRSATAAQTGQVIVSTSEPLVSVRHEMGTSGQIIDFPGFILQPAMNYSPGEFDELLG